MKNKFYQHKKDVILNFALTIALIAIIPLPWILGEYLIITIVLALLFLPILIVGFVTGLQKQEFDRVIFSKEGVTTVRVFKKTLVKWRNVSSVKYGKMMQSSLRGKDKPVKKLVIHARSEDNSKAITIYIDDRKEILESIKYYKGSSDT